jgi:hypothetical protein
MNAKDQLNSSTAKNSKTTAAMSNAKNTNTTAEKKHMPCKNSLPT